MEFENFSIKGISEYFSWNLGLLNNILPTYTVDIGKKLISSPTTSDLLNAFTCFVTNQYLKDPKLGSFQDRWLPIVILGSQWDVVISKLFGGQISKLFQKSERISIDFIHANKSELEVTLKEKAKISEEFYYQIKKDVVDKFNLTLKDYDPYEGVICFDNTNLIIKDTVKNVYEFFKKPPYWLENILSNDIVEEVLIKIKGKEEKIEEFFSLESIINRIVIYPECPIGWQLKENATNAIKEIENHIGKSTGDFFFLLTDKDMGMKWYPVLDSSIGIILKKWESFLNLMSNNGIEDVNQYKKLIISRHIAIPEGLTIRGDGEHKYLESFVFENKKDESGTRMEVANDFVVFIGENSIYDILKKIGSKEYIEKSLFIIKKMVEQVLIPAKNEKNIEGSLYIDYVEKNISFLDEQLIPFFDNLIKEIDKKSLSFLFDTNGFNKIIGFIYFKLVTEQDTTLRKKILAFIIYHSSIFDVIPDITDKGEYDDIYLATLLIKELQEKGSAIPVDIIKWAEKENIRMSHILGKEICDDILKRGKEFEESIDKLVQSYSEK